MVVLFAFTMGVLTTLVIQQLRLLDAELAHRRRLSRWRRINGRREPVLGPVVDRRKALLSEFGRICRQLTDDRNDRYALRQRGEMILAGLSA